jgi:hypothetical protein
LTQINLKKIFLETGAGATANALSQYINSMCDDRIKKSLKESMPINIPGLGPYPVSILIQTFT